jgi:putative ABC transport system permease protein
VGARVTAAKPITVIGVVSDFRSRPDADSVAQIYMPLAQHFLTASNWLYVRTSGDPLRMVGTIRKIETRNHEFAVGSIQTLEEEMSTEIAPRRFQAALLASFAALSLLLAMVGTYGVLSYTIGERTHEIGIRMALGAGHRQVLRMILVRSGKLVFAALGLGLLGALSLTRLIGSLIYGVKLTDIWTYIAACSLLGSLALMAAYLPARRAVKVDPMFALRHE